MGTVTTDGAELSVGLSEFKDFRVHLLAKCSA